MKTTTLESNDSSNSEQDNSLDGSLLKNKSNLINSTSKIISYNSKLLFDLNGNISNSDNNDDSESKLNQFVCDLIRKQIENENKIRNDISNRNRRVTTHLYEKIDRGHSQIYDYKLRDYLLSIGYDKESTTQTINFLLDSYDGSLFLDDLKSFYSSFESSSWNFKADLHLKKMLHCPLMPGFVDAFAKDNKIFKYDHLSDKLFKFILNHRLPAEMINSPYLEHKIVLSNLRRKILIQTEEKFYEESGNNKSLCLDQQCIFSLKSCCSQEKIQNLIDSKSVTYWQTSNSEKCENHWILIMLKENIKLTNLSLCSIGNKTDDFLKSINIEVLAGSGNKLETVVSKCDYSLTLNNDYSICNCFPNNQNISYLKIVFKRTTEKNYWGKNNDQIKIKSIKLVGKRVEAKPYSVTVQDASICWYFEMLSSMALIQSQLIPPLHTKFLQITKNALQNIPPLSLSLNSKDSFLTPIVLEKVDSFLKNFLEVTSTSLNDKSEAIIIYLWFNLARGNLKGIMESLLLILDNYELNYNFLDLLTKIDEASQLSLRKTAEPVSFKFLKPNAIDTKTYSEKLNETTTINDETSEFTLEAYKSSTKGSFFDTNSSYNMIIEIEKNVTLTNINLKLKLESIGIQSVIVILAFDKEKPALEKFTQYDSFTSKEQFDSYIKSKSNPSKISSKNSNYEAFHYELYENQIDILLEIAVTNVANFAIVKFIRSKENSPKTITVSNIKVLGFKHNSLELYDKLKIMPKYSAEEQSQNSILVNTVLWFCCQIAEQHKNQEKSRNEEIVKLFDFENFKINDLWKLYVKSLEIKKQNENSKEMISFSVNLKISILILLYELVNCAEIRSNIKQSNKSTHILANLCDIIDGYEEEKMSGNLNEMNKILEFITKEIIKNGICVFFPKNEQIELFESIMDQNSKTFDSVDESVSSKQNMSLKRISNQILFEAFCKQFSQNKLSLIEHVTRSQNIYENCSDLHHLISLQEKILKLCFSLDSSIDHETERKLMEAASSLLNSVQSNIFFNIRNRLSATGIDRECVFGNFLFKNVNNFVHDYTKFLVKQSETLIESLKQNLDKNEPKIFSKLNLFYCDIFYKFILWLMDIFDKLEMDLCTDIVTILSNTYKSISELEYFYLGDEMKSENEKLLETWTFNSKTKSSIFDLAIDYNYPLAKRFVIEFDANSSLVFTESSELTTYSFVDSAEKVHLLSGKLGSTSWNERMEIKSDSFVTLYIRSNKDLKLNNTFFLKFSICAYGYDQPINKPNFRDLIELLSSLFGLQLHRASNDLKESSLLETSQPNKKMSILEKQTSKDESSEKTPTFMLCGFQHQLSLNSSTQALIGTVDKSQVFNDMNHDMYRILLRGGCPNNISTEQNDSKLHKILTDITNYFVKLSNNESNEDLDLIQKFMSLYDKNYESQEKILQSCKSKIGGLTINEIILRLFCAILWQDSSIKYEDLFDQNNQPLFNKSALLAYKAAESTRMFIVEKQQIHKIKHSKSHNTKNLADILNEKILFLLNFNRVPVDLLDYELNKVETKSNNNENSDLLLTKKKSRIPKSDSPKINLIFEFVFDKSVNNIEQLELILIKKKHNSALIAHNFDLATQFVQVIIGGNGDQDFKYDTLLIFLSNFYSTESNFKFTNNYDQKSSFKKSKILFPPTLKSNTVHYLQDLYACGLDNENLVQQSYFNFIKVLVNFSTHSDTSFYKLSKQDRNQNIRLKSFITCLLDIDWELYDLKFVTESNLFGYLLKNMITSLPIMDYVDEKNSLPSEVLEDIFDLSKEKFNQLQKIMKTNSENESTKNTSCDHHLPSVKEVDEKEEENRVESQINKDDSESFDLKIFPKMYQSVFQISNSKHFETASLIKCVSAEIKTYEHYEKYIVARYMFWKYFSKLNTNFYCDSCEVVLTGFRYVCLECRDHCLCLPCFSKSIVDEKCDSNEPTFSKPMINFSSSSTHKPSHRMLVLDHYCNQCQSLIIGKRARCTECSDYDLCLMCHKNPEYNDENHKKEHNMKILEPTILVAKSHEIPDSQTFLYLHSQYLLTNFSLKICEMLRKYLPTNNIYLPLLKDLYSQVFNTTFHLAYQAGFDCDESLILEKELSRSIKLYAFYNQESLIGLLSCILNTTQDMIKENLNLELDNFKFNSNQFNKLFYLGTCNFEKLDEPSLIKILDFLFVLQNNIYDSTFIDTVGLMFIEIFKSILSVLGPETVDLVAKKHLDKIESRFVFEDIDASKREYTLEFVFCLIYDYMSNGFQKWASSYLNFLFSLNQIDTWRPRLENMLSNIFDNILNSLDSYKSKVHSKFYVFIYSFICFQLDINCGQWIDYKNESLYDGAGILRSTNDFKIGLTNITYSESYNFGHYVSLVDPESRKYMCLKNQKLGKNFRKSNEKSKIPVISGFDLNDKHFHKLVEIFKKIFQKYPEFIVEGQLESLETNSNKSLVQVYESAHINRKKDFYKVFKQLNLSNNLLLFGLVSLFRSYVDKALTNTEITSYENIDKEFLGLTAKISFLNTNMNSNWKLVHLRYLLTLLMTHENFSSIKDLIEKDQVKEVDQSQSSESEQPMRKTSSFSKSEIKHKSNKTSSLMETFSINTCDSKKSVSSKDDLTVEDLKLGFSLNAVMGVCDTSSLIFSMEDMIADYQQNETNNEKKNKISSKLLEDCLAKLAKYDSSSSSNSKSEELKISQLIQNKQSNNEPMRAVIKLVSSANIILSCRELLILLVNLSKMKSIEQNAIVPKEDVYNFTELNCRSEYDFIQLMDVLYYSDSLFKFKSLVKNLINSLLENQNSESASKILNKISLIACDFMLPEFKLVKKVTWSHEDMRIYDTGKLKNKALNESLSEENFSFTPNQVTKNLNEIEKMSNMSNKPIDIEKLSTQDQSTLLIVFDQNQTKKTTQVNSSIGNSSQKNKINKYEKFLQEANLKKNTSSYLKYCVGDNFEYKLDNGQISDTESLDSIMDEPDLGFNKDKKKLNTKKRNKSNNDTLNDVYNNTAYDSDEDNCEKYVGWCDSDTLVSSDSEDKKKSNNKSGKKTAILFQVLSKRKESSYDSNNDDYEDNNNDEDDEENYDENESGEDSSDSSDEDTSGDENNSDNESDYNDYDYSADEWYTSANNTAFSENDDEKYKKCNFKITLDNLENVPYIAIKNQKMIKWKFCRTDWSTETCSFKIYTTLSKNFESSFYLLNEIISQTKCSKLILKDLWSCLIKICCVQTFNKRLKVLSLLIKIIQKAYQNSEPKNCINIFELKPLKNLHYTLEFSNKEDKNFSRALYELFFFAEKLAIKWSIEKEYMAKMRDKEYFMEKIGETSYFINLIMGSIKSSNQDDKNIKFNDSLQTNTESNINIVNKMSYSDEIDNEADDSDENNNDESDEDIFSSPQRCYDEAFPNTNSDEVDEHQDESEFYDENW